MTTSPSPSPGAGRPAGLTTSALFGGIAVALGAFAAHGMKGRFDDELLRSFETGVRYQLYHALALLGCAALQAFGVRTALSRWLFTGGVLLFSGSIYGLVLSDRAWRWLGPVTPIGGVLLLAGWGALLFARRPTSSSP